TLVADFDIVEFLHTLVLRCTDLLEVAEAGLMLADQRGGLRIMASSSERARLLELFELQNEQGPCLDCFRSGQPVTQEDLGGVPAGRAQVNVDDAFDMLRRYARNHNLRLHHVAESLIAGGVTIEQLGPPSQIERQRRQTKR